MSQTIESFEQQGAVPQDVREVRPTPDASVYEGYRPMSMTAVIGLVLGVAGAVSFLTILGFLICLGGIIAAIVAARSIRRSNGELGGRKVALTGLLLSTLFLVGGIAFHTHAYATEVPDGFQRVSFARDISRPGFVEKNGLRIFHPAVEKLNGKKIFVKGYMYPMPEESGLRTFVLVKDNQQCCFGGRPSPEDMILVRMKDGLAVDHFPDLVSVAGVFRTSGSQNFGPLTPVYELDAVFFDHARTRY